MKQFNLEIEYKFHPTDQERIHWMYFAVSAQSATSAKEKAKAHFTKQMRECGWTKITTLTEIRPMGKTRDPVKHKKVSEEVLPAGRKKTSTTKRSTTTRKTTTAKKKTTTKRSPTKKRGTK